MCQRKGVTKNGGQNAEENLAKTELRGGILPTLPGLGDDLMRAAERSGKKWWAKFHEHLK